ncbi:MAG: transposase [Roseivirga sp.]
MPLRAIITEGTEADCKQGVELLKDLPAGGVIADRGYDTEQVVQEVKSKNRQCVIPSRKHRKVERSYNREVYHTTSYDREHVFVSEALARDMYALCQERKLISGRYSN